MSSLVAPPVVQLRRRRDRGLSSTVQRQPLLPSMGGDRTGETGAEK